MKNKNRASSCKKTRPYGIVSFPITGGGGISHPTQAFHHSLTQAVGEEARSLLLIIDSIT